MAILYHVADAQIFHGNMIVAGDQLMAQFVEKVAALVGNAFVLPL